MIALLLLWEHGTAREGQVSPVPGMSVLQLQLSAGLPSAGLPHLPFPSLVSNCCLTSAKHCNKSPAPLPHVDTALQGAIHSTEIPSHGETG